MEKHLHVEGNDLVVRFVLTDEEIDFLVSIEESGSVELGEHDEARFSDLFGSGLVEFSDYYSSKYGGVHLTDLGSEYLDLLK